MMYWYGNGMTWWGYLLMAISMVVFWGAVVFGIVALVRYVGRGGQQGGSEPPERRTPEQVLAERFARGEIDEDEYHWRLNALRTGGRSMTPS